MRCYGLIGVKSEVCADIKEVLSGYSIDSIRLETATGKEYVIDFEEGDYGIENNQLYFRLKSLGCTFCETWESLERDKDIEFENDIAFFKSSKIKVVSLYLPEEVRVNLTEPDFVFKLDDLYFKIGDTHIIPETLHYTLLEPYYA